MTVLRWGSVTDVGVTREVNQDSMLTAEPLFAVADGMGGHQGGEVASATALEILDTTFRSGHTQDELLEAVRRANAKVWDKAQLDDTLHGMGTTLTAIARIDDEESENAGIDAFAVVNVGDSRTYIFHEGELRQITTDHSFVEEMVRAGEITAQDAEGHPKRNILTKALGVEPTVEVDISLINPAVGDRFLLCSDGLVRELTDDQIAAVLRRLKSPQEAAKELVAQANAHGGHDNITVIVVDVEDENAESTATVTPHKSKQRKAKPAIRKTTPPTVTFRTIAFITAALALVGVGAGSVVWYARSSYYVGLEGQQLVIYQGRPESVLWFDATIVERTNVLLSDVLPSVVPNLQEGVTQSSLKEAETYVTNLKNAGQAAAQAALNTTTTSSTTSTTLVP